MKRLLVGAMCAALLGAACGGPDDQPAAPEGTATGPAGTGSPTSPPTTGTAGTPTGECADVISGLSTRERLAQLLVVGVPPGDPEAAVATVREHQLGGVFIGGNATALFTGDALSRMQEATDLPVSVAVDDEGGRVQRLDDLVGDIPSAREMARTMSPDEVRELARERGEQMREYGVTVDYAPVLDLTEGAAGGVIGDRSFGADPQTATEYALAFSEGLAEAGIRPVVKHFPGHGRADGDSHQELVTTPPLDELRERDLVPYESLGEFPADTGVMVGHLNVPGLTDGEPASVSAPAYELLRQDYSFDGVVLTDDLGAMRAISDRYPLPEAVLRALQAGADRPLWSSGGDVGPVLDRLERAVADGELSTETVTESLNRVLSDKGVCG
ncbi:glycoside hydrolase family 3 N-terminal domain-containing protein [Saccharomonospora iraqiensis]|uniref:glycoside hydrolase family 3 N-terminal domain-containing protein n=1 Tax=Saccharomonospora iraqiensis TaxID=52698 RepID=UPI00022E7533|nr:glycoside hydrolase family 3 N-terminal domain-containing protein [Saccharomonospora iraqiensis]